MGLILFRIYKLLISYKTIKLRRINFLKLISLIVFYAFVAQQFAFAAPGLSAQELSFLQGPKAPFNLPSSVAFIDEVYKANTKQGKTIILLKDAHTNESGQLNVAKALESILPDEKINHVFLEAGKGDVSLSFLKSKASLSMRKKVGLKYLRQGLLQGSEYLNLTSSHDFTLWGVENQTLYKKTLTLYQELINERKDFTHYLKKIDSTLKTLKPKVLNPNLYSFDEKRQDYLNDKLPLTSYFQILISEAKRQGIPLEFFPHMKALKGVQRQEKRINFKKATEEQQKLIESLNKTKREELLNLTKTTHNPFKVSMNDSKQKAFFYLLEDLIENKNKYPNLSKYISYLKIADKLSAKDILKEQERLEKILIGRLSESNDDKEFILIQDNLKNLKDLLELTLTPEKFQDYSQKKSLYDLIYLTGFLNTKIKELESNYEKVIFLEDSFKETLLKAKEFYELTQ